MINSTMSDFDVWWASYWVNPFSVGVMNEAMKEVARAAWDAAKKDMEAKEKL